jgi:hypothetical protein
LTLLVMQVFSLTFMLLLLWKSGNPLLGVPLLFPFLSLARSFRIILSRSSNAGGTHAGINKIACYLDLCAAIQRQNGLES